MTPPGTRKGYNAYVALWKGHFASKYSFEHALTSDIQAAISMKIQAYQKQVIESNIH